MAFKKDNKIINDFSKVTITLSSPDSILDLSNGEVVKPETINYRSYKPEFGGLFCERIFGPVKDFECACGKYKRIRYKGIVCDRCGVEVTEKKVRRQRLGHIKLVVPVAHVWYFKSLPNKIGYLLGLSSKKLESIIYYERYVVIQPGITEQDGVMKMDLLTEEEYLDIMEALPKENKALDNDNPDKFLAKMGAESLIDLLARVDLDGLSFYLRDKAANETSQQRKQEALKRLKVVESFRDANTRVQNNPEWMVVKILPVIPPELRPLVPLDGGRFASSDLNDLYRRVIIRNNRLKRLMEIKAPGVILRNEKRMLQEAVDSLFDNSRKSNAVKTDGGRPLKSLTDVLKGKQGRFRQNLLGKRVDYSGRSVIVVGPELKMHECGLPKDMAAELFKPFVIRRLIERGIVKTVKSAKKLVDRKEPIIWEILENVLKGHPILLNRAPTLHRLGFQAFQPKLIEGKAIQLHPLVCTAFNADFDGDQMAVHVPLSNSSILETQTLMLSTHNILNPQNGTPIALPSQDMVLGLYYISKGRRTDDKIIVKGEGKCFYSLDEVIMAFDHGVVALHAYIKVMVNIIDDEGNNKKELIETTVGRAIFNKAVPPEVGFINAILTKKALRKIISDIVKITDVPTTVKFLDEIKEIGFRKAFEGGLSFNLDDIKIPDSKFTMIEKAEGEVEEVWANYNMGLITNNERYNQIIDIWTRVNTRISENLLKNLSNDNQGFNPVYMMLDSGARGSKEQIRQLAGIRGLMAKPKKSGTSANAIIENPILSNFKEGLSVLEYFISTHGARKGLADTALKTADAGYLTRRLVDVAHDVVITEKDCGTLRGLNISALKDNDELVVSLKDRVVGRTALNDVLNPISGEMILSAGDLITEELSTSISQTVIESLEIRSALTCETRRGICSKCYGINLSSGNVAQKGDAVGILAAQSIGEPGTQLTLRTFHVGGTASATESESQIKAKFDGKLEFDGIRLIESKGDNGEVIKVVLSRAGEVKVIDAKSKQTLTTNHIPYGSHLYIEENKKIKKGDLICGWDPYNAVIVTEKGGKIIFENIIEGITFREEVDEQTGHREKVIVDTKDKTKNPVIKIIKGKDEATYNIPVGAHISVSDGDSIGAGHVIVKIPRIAGKLRDITGGLPRVTELFEARNPSNPAVISEIDGVVSFGGIKRGNREIFVESKDGDRRKYMVSLSKYILVQENDFIKAGMPLCEGPITPNDILAIEGPHSLQEYLVNEVQEVYRLQGVVINDKHIETIVRQMMRKVKIEDSGDTRFLENEATDKFDFIKQNDWIYDKKVVSEAGDSKKLNVGEIVTLRQLREENSHLKRNDMSIIEFRDAVPATSSPLLQGITKASLGTKSFISAASFQETTRVLSEASISGKEDSLRGLKENVIVGHLIPAGTGMRSFQDTIVGSNEEFERLEAAKEERRIHEDIIS